MHTTTLAQALRDEHEAAMIRQAEIICRWPIGRERHEQAMILVRAALWERGLGRITDATQYRIYSILNFAMPEEATLEGDPMPLAELEREAEIETAFYQQLDRQSCPECGDGICPVEEK
jgi:hypothetical protein